MILAAIGGAPFLLSEIVMAPPLLRRYGSSPKEADAVMILSHNLESMDRYATRFEDALALFQFSKGKSEQLSAAFMASLSASPRPPAESIIQTMKQTMATTNRLSAWAFIACRDAAMTFYHFYEAMSGAKETLKACKTISRSVDHARLDQAIKLFEGSFPSYADLRHAVAHSAEMFNISKKTKMHMMKQDLDLGGIKIEGSSALYQEILVEHRFSTSRYGVEISLEMSVASLVMLRRVAEEFYAAFGPPLDQTP